MPSRVRSAAFLARALGTALRASRRPRTDHRPVGRRERAVAAAGFRGLQLSLLITFALIFGLAASESRSPWLAVARLTLGIVLLAEGYLLGTNWLGGRRLTVWRVQSRRGREGASGSPAARVLLDFVIQLAGVVWLAGGVYLVWLGLAARF
jgi:hypothetical protein